MPHGALARRIQRSAELAPDLGDRVILAGEDAILMINGYYFAVLCSVILPAKAL